MCSRSLFRQDILADTIFKMILLYAFQGLIVDGNPASGSRHVLLCEIAATEGIILILKKKSQIQYILRSKLLVNVFLIRIIGLIVKNTTGTTFLQ